MIRATVLILLSAVFGSNALSAAETPKWLELRSEHFVLYTDVSEAKGQRLLTDFEGRVTGFSAAFGMVRTAQFPIEVFLFGQDKDFAEIAPTSPDGKVLNAYLLKGPDRTFVIAKDKSPDDISKDVGHALGHLFFEHQVLWRPFWISEGAAEYFRKLGSNADGKNVSAENGFAVKDLLTIVPSATYNDNETGSAFRLQSYRLVRMLLEEHPDKIRDFLADLRGENGSAESIDVAVATLQERMDRYAETALKLPTQMVSPQVIEVDEATIALHRGDVLLAGGKTAAAGIWYKADSKEARAARAILTRFTRGAAEAIRTLDRTARELPDSGLVQFHFGSIETQIVKDAELQVAALERAVQLLPQYGPAYAELARVYTITGHADKAQPLINKALDLSPNIGDHIFEIRSESHLALGEYEEAYRTIKIAESLPHAAQSDKERFALKVGNMRKKIETSRREGEDRRLQEIRREVAAQVAEREPRAAAPPPPPPVPPGRISYEIEARSRIEVVQSILPDYPETLRKSGIAGKVVLRVGVGADGLVKSVEVSDSKVPSLNVATVNAVKKWSFKTGSAVSIKLVIDYSLQ
jgi:TonB family protein